MTSASILNIIPEKLPVHQITIVGIATAIETPHVSEVGIQVECLISDYISKDKPVELQVTLFHPSGSRFTNQTTSIKHGSTLFFSGSLTVIDDKLYVELHNFSFIRINQSFTSPSAKQMPWLLKTPTSNNPAPTNITRTIHNMKKLTQNSNPPPPQNTKPKKSSNRITIDPPITPTVRSTHNTPQQPITPTSEKRKTRSSKRIINKKRKLADIASDIIATEDARDAENDRDSEDAGDAENGRDPEDGGYTEDAEDARDTEDVVYVE